MERGSNRVWHGWGVVAGWVIAIATPVGGALAQAADRGEGAVQPTVRPEAAGPVAPGEVAPPGRVPFAPITAVEVRGNGPKHLILIPEINCDHSVWESFAARNASRYTMHLVQLPGYAGSAAPEAPAPHWPVADRPWTANAVEALRVYIQEKGLEKPVVVGASIGGYVALRVGLEHPGLVGGIVSLDHPPAVALQGAGGPALAVEKRLEYVEKMAPGMLKMEEAAWVEHWGMVGAGAAIDPARAQAIGEMMGRHSPLVGARYLLEAVSDDLTERLKAISVRTLFVGTVPDQDMFYGKRMDLRRFWARAVPASPRVQVVRFEDCRHFVSEDAPAELDEAIDAFINERTVTARWPKVEMAGPAAEEGLPRVRGVGPDDPKPTPTLRPQPKVTRPTLNLDGTPREEPEKRGGLFDGLGNPPKQPAAPAREGAKPGEGTPAAEPPK